MVNDIIFDYDKCRTDIFENGEFVVALDIPKIQANTLCIALTERSDSYDFDWQYSGGRVCVRQLRRKDDGISSQWISVDDALPESEDFYLVYLFDGHRDEWATDILWWNADHQQFLEWDFMNNVTHWMQLPELPEGDLDG